MPAKKVIDYKTSFSLVDHILRNALTTNTIINMAVL